MAKIILTKLELMGVDMCSRQLIWLYLTGRRKQCAIGQAISDVIILKSVVGEVLLLDPKDTVEYLRTKNIKMTIDLVEYADDISALIMAK